MNRMVAAGARWTWRPIDLFPFRFSRMARPTGGQRELSAQEIGGIGSTHAAGAPRATVRVTKPTRPLPDSFRDNAVRSAIGRRPDAPFPGTDVPAFGQSAMKLHWSPRSPYVRKVMIAAHETGLADRIICVRTVVSAFAPAEDLFRDNPLNKLPTLVLDDGTAVYDSRVVCEYLDSLHEGRKLFPPGGLQRLHALRDQALGDGLLDVLMVRLVERLKPQTQRSPRIVAANERKTAAALDRLETDAAALEGRTFDIGHVAIGTALGYVDFRFGADGWREGRPRLAAWHAAFAERPSVRAVPVRDDP